MPIKQNDMEKIIELVKQGAITADEGNVRIVEQGRYRLITTSLARETRKALNKAVKDGRLTHLKKEGLKPEAYCKKGFEYLARAARNKIEFKKLKALRDMCI